MSRYLYGDRIGKTGRLLPACNGFILDETRTRVLLTKRADNGRWCLPGGMMETGESVAEACEHEVWEETGLRVRAVRLVGVYSTPHRVTEYADGNRFHFVALVFTCEVLDGELGLSDETTAVGYFSRAEMEELDIVDPHVERIDDAFANEVSAFVR